MREMALESPGLLWQSFFQPIPDYFRGNAVLYFCPGSPVKNTVRRNLCVWRGLTHGLHKRAILVY